MMLTGSTSTSDVMGPSGPYFHLTNTMSQVSTPEFDFLFEIKERTEARIEKLSSRLEKAEAKVADLSDDPITNSQQRQLGRFEGLVATRSARLTQLQADLAELEAFPLPEDELIIDYDRSRGGWRNTTVTFQESPYDDLFDAGEYIRVGVRAWNDDGKRRLTSTQLALNHPDYTGDKYVLGDSTFSYANITVKDSVFKYDNAEVFIEVGGEVLQTLTIV